MCSLTARERRMLENPGQNRLQKNIPLINERKFFPSFIVIKLPAPILL